MRAAQLANASPEPKNAMYTARTARLSAGSTGCVVTASTVTGGSGQLVRDDRSAAGRLRRPRGQRFDVVTGPPNRLAVLEEQDLVVVHDLDAVVVGLGRCVHDLVRPHLDVDVGAVPHEPEGETRPTRCELRAERQA